MSKFVVALPREHLQALVKNGQKAVERRCGVKETAFRYLKRTGETSEETLGKLNKFFEEIGLLPLNYAVEKTKEDRQQADLGDERQQPLKGDAWNEIRQLYLHRENEEAISLARRYLQSGSAAAQISAARSLIYINHRLGWQSGVVRAAKILGRVLDQHGEAFPAADRFNSACDIAKCLTEHNQHQAATGIYRRLSDIRESKPRLLREEILSSVLRGIGQHQERSGAKGEGFKSYRQATEHAENHIDARAGNATGVIACLEDWDSGGRHSSAAWQELADCAAQFDSDLKVAARLQPADPTGGQTACSLTLANALATWAFRPGTDSKRTLELLEYYSDQFNEVGLADHKVIAFGPTRSKIEHLVPGDHRMRGILMRMFKDKMVESNVRPLVECAKKLLSDLP